MSSISKTIVIVNQIAIHVHVLLCNYKDDKFYKVSYKICVT